MSIREILGELGFPLRQPVLLAGMATFYLLTQLALAAGLFGLWLMVVIFPAMVRFLIGVCEARIYQQPIEAPGIEKFSWIAGAWSFAALLWILIAVWCIVGAANGYGVLGGAIVGAAALTVLPAPLAMLALSRSPLASMNPVALVSLVRVCGWAYFWVPAVLSILALLVYLLLESGAPRLLTDLADIYVVFLLFTLTGAVVAKSDAVKLAADPIPEETEPNSEGLKLDRARAGVLDHAYGLLSRGNRDGGLRHIDAFLQKSDVVLDDAEWFFENMLCWEQSDPALFFAQHYLTLLLDRGEAVKALKVFARCGLENPRFRPAMEDRARLAELVDAHGRDDLRKLLG